MVDNNDNPMIMGESIPALLAEEWMIQPQSPFPSFLEIAMIHQTERAIGDSIAMVLLQCRQRLRTQLYRFDYRSMEETSPRATKILRWFQHLLQRGGTHFARFMERYHRELGCCMRFAIEITSLRMTGSCLAECLYGTKRVVVQGADRKLLPLSKSTQTRLAFVLAFSSYGKFLLKRVLARILRARRSSSRYNVEPVLMGTGKLANTWFLFSYLVGRTHYTNLRDYTFGHVLRRRTQEDASTNNDRVTNIPAVDKTRLSTIATAAGVTLATLGFCVQLRSQYNSELRSQRPLSILPPPPLSQRQPSCPLCSRQRPVQPTVVTTTGFVFCNICIRRHVREHKTCPVTALGPVKDTDLVRLYEPTQ